MTTKMRGDQLDTGTSADQVVQLDGLGRLPAVDGSQLTGVSGGDVANPIAENLRTGTFSVGSSSVAGSPATIDTYINFGSNQINMYGGGTVGTWDNTTAILNVTPGAAGEYGTQIVTVQGKNSSYASSNNIAGQLHLYGGTQTGLGTGGTVILKGGIGGTNSAPGGKIRLFGGSNNSAGSMIVEGGVGVLGGPLNGGSVTINSGAGFGSGQGGALTIEAGTAGATNAIGGPASLYGGEGTGSGTGGDVDIAAGKNDGAGNAGVIKLHAPRNAIGVTEVQFWRDTNTGHTAGNYVALTVPAALAADRSWVLPDDDPTVVAGQFITTNASGVLSFAAGGGGGTFTELSNGSIFGGTGAGASLTAGSPTVGGAHNFLAGTNAGASITTGDYNIAIGLNTLNAITDDISMIAIGRDAGRYADGAVVGAEGVILIGEYAGSGTVTNASTNLRYDIAIGYGAMRFNRGSGQRNVAVGRDALRGSTVSGLNGAAINVAVGDQAAHNITTGDNNVVVGGLSGYSLSDGSRNIIIGQAAGFSITTGTDNIIIGRSAGPTTNASNQLFIDSIQASSDTPLIHGNFSTEEVTINGDLGVTSTIRLFEDAGGATFNYVALRAPAIVGGSPAQGAGSPQHNPLWTIPAAQNNPGDPLGIDLGEYTVANLPSATTYPNCWALATNAVGGRTAVRSDGTNWKVIAVEGATVTT